MQITCEEPVPGGGGNKILSIGLGEGRGADQFMDTNLFLNKDQGPQHIKKHVSEKI
jgi:hypothetical protein